MSQNFQLYSKYYNLLYADKNYGAEADYVTKLIKKNHPRAESILEFGSGTGIHGMELIKRGYEVYGLELSENMVEQARSKGFPCQCADITTARINRSFDIVLALFHVISYQAENHQLTAAFRSANAHLETGGLFIFDFWYSPAVYHQGAVARVKRMENKEIAVTRFADPLIDVNRNLVDVRYSMIVQDKRSGQFSEFSESHPMRHFSLPELQLLADLTGFDTVLSEEYLTGKPPGKDSWGVCLVLKKRKG